jgi:integrase
LDSAKAKGLRSGENPARWRGHLALILPKRQRLTRGHHAALPYQQLPEFIKQLRQHDSISACALEFCILTAARSNEVIGARWKEIDPKTKIWVIPADRMKAAKEHRIPLSPRAMSILKRLRPAKTGPFVFEGTKPKRPLSTMAMAMQLRRLGHSDITVHGFRSSFRDWVWEETEFPHEVAEQALAHTIQNKADAAYRRGDALERGRSMMNAWADFCQQVVN